MRTSNVGRYALRLTFGPATAEPTINNSMRAPASDRVISVSATCMALLGISVSSFSLKQMLSTNTSPRVPLGKF